MVITVADLGFEKGGSLLGGRSPPAALAALVRRVWGPRKILEKWML